MLQVESNAGGRDRPRRWIREDVSTQQPHANVVSKLVRARGSVGGLMRQRGVGYWHGRHLQERTD